MFIFAFVSLACGVRSPKTLLRLMLMKSRSMFPSRNFTVSGGLNRFNRDYGKQILSPKLFVQQTNYISKQGHSRVMELVSGHFFCKLCT